MAIMLAAFAVSYYLAAGFGVVLGYHRMLAHRSFAAPRWLARTLVFIGLPAGTPIQWAGNHRHHHQHADREGDVHSPVLGGFWHAHVGWYLGTNQPLVCLLYSLAGPGRMLFDAWHRPRSNQQFNHLAPDVAADPFFRFVSRPVPYQVLCSLHALAPLAVLAYFFGGAGVLTLWAVQVFVYNLGDAVDSVLHLYGEAPYPGADRARNLPVMGYLIVGDGWHANHHAFPSSARHGLLPHQPDIAFAVITLFARLGWAWDIKVPTADEVARRLGPRPEASLVRPSQRSS